MRVETWSWEKAVESGIGVRFSKRRGVLWFFHTTEVHCVL